MNKAITDGLVLMPPPFADGLDVWANGDGTPGSPTYDGDPNAALVPSDQDFAGCLELIKTAGNQKIRYMGQTPILPGCYLRVTAKVKAMSGPLPSVRIGAFAADSGGAAVNGQVLSGPSVALTAYGTVFTVSAIIGTGSRGGVDMSWSLDVAYAHIGMDLTGSNGGVVRIDDLVVEDITSAYLRDMMDWVDVRDYGAVGDGVTDDRAAFEAADVDAGGREILVPAGDYYIGSSLTIDTEIRFEGRLVMPVAARLTLTRNFDLPSYIDAFGGDEMEGLRKGLQALFNFTDHDALDMRGRRVEVTGPIDVQAAVENQTTWAIRRVLRNGQLNVVAGPAWDDTVVTSQATYSTSNSLQLTNVANVANIEVGSLVTGNGVGREVYVKEKNVGAQTVTLSLPLYGAAGTQTFTFTRFKYALDFSGFDYLDKFVMQEVEVQCNGAASAVLLPPEGFWFQMTDCYLIRPKDRGVTSHGRGCAGLEIDRCSFISDESSTPVQDRKSICFNANYNDVKIRNCRASRFAHFGFLAGGACLVEGNHFFNGDDEPLGVRKPGLVITRNNSGVVVSGNYIDNCYIELGNEHDAQPSYNNEPVAGSVTITGNVFLCIGVAPNFSWIVAKPYGPGNFIDGLAVSNNTFQAFNGDVSRIERVDSSFAPLDLTQMRNITFENNTFYGVTQKTVNPVSLPFTQATAQTTWNCDFTGWLPFGGRAKVVESIVAQGAITTATFQPVTTMPYLTLETGTGGAVAQVTWSTAARGTVRLRGRMDIPN